MLGWLSKDELPSLESRLADWFAGGELVFGAAMLARGSHVRGQNASLEDSRLRRSASTGLLSSLAKRRGSRVLDVGVFAACSKFRSSTNPPPSPTDDRHALVPRRRPPPHRLPRARTSLLRPPFFSADSPLPSPQQQPFRDAGYARADFHLSLQSCIYGIHRAIALHLLDLSTFDLVAYETYEKVENGDWNWLTPGFVAFASPVEPSYVAALNGGGAGRRPEGSRPRLSKAFENVLQEFETGGVKVVIR